MTPKTPNRIRVATTWLLPITLALLASACGEAGPAGVASSTGAEASVAQVVCDQYPPRVEHGWVTVRAERASAEDVVVWQEEMARRAGVGIVSQYRQLAASEELTVCLYWGSVPAPGGPPSMSLPPYDASTWVIGSDGHSMLDTAGWTTSLTELPSDVVSH